MKRRFPILIKVILSGLIVSILTVGVAATFGYINQRKRSEQALITSINNALTDIDYVYSEGRDVDNYITDIKSIRDYVEGIYNDDPYKKTLEDFPTFKEYEDYYQALYPWIFPQGGFGLSREMAIFQAAYYRLLNILTSAKLSTATNSVYVAFYDSNVTNRLVFIADSRLDKDYLGMTFYNLPGSHYDVKSSDTPAEETSNIHRGISLNGHLTRYTTIYAQNEQGDSYEVARVFIEYDLIGAEADALNVLKNELFILGLASIVLIVLYAFISYWMFVRNINTLSRASTQIRQNLIDNKADEMVEVKIRSHDEIQILANSFMEMQKEIINYIEIVKKEALEKERSNAELLVASKIQSESLPDKEYQDSNIVLRAFIDPAREVGGDFYDYFYLKDNRLAVVISDVSGKGVPASLFMMKGKELIKSALDSYSSLKEAIEAVNNILEKNNKELLFITSFVGIIDFVKEEIRYINAGHEKPYIITPTGIIKLEGESNVVLGLEANYSFVEESHKFNKGDSIFMFTDGLNESINDKREEFGYERIENILSENINSSVETIINSINSHLAEFVKEEEQFDDVTMLAIKLNDNTLSLHYEEKEYKIISDIVDKFDDRFSSISQEKRSVVGIIIDELVNNLVSYEKREDLIIDISFKLDKDELNIKVMSNGDDYNPFSNHQEKYLESFHPEIEEGGFGLSIIKELAKSYAYEYKDNHSIITITISVK